MKKIQNNLLNFTIGKLIKVITTLIPLVLFFTIFLFSNFIIEINEIEKLYSAIFDKAIQLNPIHSEGFILVDKNFHRISITSPQHNALVSLRKENTIYWKADSNTNEKLMFEIVRCNDNQDFLCYFPEWKEYYCLIKERHENFINYIENTWAQLQRIDNQRTFASEVKKYPFSGILFEFKEDYLSNFRHYFAVCQFSKYYNISKKQKNT